MKKAYGILIALLILSHFATAAPKIAPSCKRIFYSENDPSPLHTKGAWSIFDNYTSFNYKEFSKVLFLSDGGRSKYIPAQNRPLNPRHFISSDYNAQKGVDLILDNNHLSFFLHNQSFDLIVMNRGLCPCSSPVSCGGIKNSKADMVNFLRQVVRSLDKTSSDSPSIALLTGYYWPEHFKAIDGRPIPETWQNAVQQISQELPGIQIRTLMDPSGIFMGVAIVTSKFVDLGEALNSLNPQIQPQH